MNSCAALSRTYYKHHQQVFFFFFLEGNTGPWLVEQKGQSCGLLLNCNSGNVSEPCRQRGVSNAVQAHLWSSAAGGGDASSKGGLAAPGTVLWHEAKNKSWDPAENIAAITSRSGPSALCVVSFIPPAHSAGECCHAWRYNGCQKITTNYHMAACENAEFMFWKKSATVRLMDTRWTLFPSD